VNATTLFTIGHSNRTLNEFFSILHEQGIRQLIDVRSLPQSRRYPSYNRNTLSLACEDEQIAYAWLGHELGGLRSEKSDSRHCALTSGFRGYADHMSSRPFLNGIEKLTALARAQPVAIMCAEREPSQCHRSMIADYLSLRGWRIIHLLAPQQQINHTINPLARSENNLPVYDLLNQEQLDLGF
jgi:uncharacterized protein (DUF488 family)